MHVRLLCTLGALLCLCLVAAGTADAEPLDAAALHARGRQQLSRADFRAALASFRAAARAAPENATYAKDALVLRRVVAMRKAVAGNKGGRKWESTATNLHVFYLQNGLHAEAVQLDRRGLTLLANGSAEARLAEALLEADDAPGTLQLLEAKRTWQRDVRHVIYGGIALARLKRYEQALGVQRSLRLPAQADPQLLRDAARLHGLLGLEGPCSALLVRCFEATPPAVLQAHKARVRAHPDFRRVAAGPTFARAMKTPSKIKPAGCSGGKDCGSCPSRGGCGGKG